MAEVLWALETAHPIDTPERRAALEKRLAERVRLIAERSVQEHYRAFFRDRLFQLLRSRRSPRPPLGGAARDGGRGRRFEPPSPFPFNGRPQAEPTPLKRRQQEVLLAVVVNHPFILNEVSEELASLEFSAPDLDRLCQEILKAHALNPDLDGSALRLHLTRNGFARIVEGVLSSQVLEHARFARPDAEPEAVRSGWVDARDQFLKDHIRTQIAATERELAEDTTEEVWERFLQTMLELKAKNGSAEGGGTL
jgi:DNA primase